MPTVRAQISRTAGDGCRRCGLRPLGASLQDEVEGRLGGTPEAGEATGRDDLAQARLTRLRAEREPDLLIAGGGRADERRAAVIHPSYRVEVVLKPVARVGLDNQPGSVGCERAQHVSGGADGVAHVV